jgi:hypothetical protein
MVGRKRPFPRAVGEVGEAGVGEAREKLAAVVGMNETIV